MRIIICNDNFNAHYYERMSWAKSLNFSGHESYLWQMQNKSVYDAFDEINPDIVFLQGYNLTDGTIECIKERPELKLVIRVSDWSKWNDELDRTKYPVLKAEEKEISYLNQIQKLGNPLILHTHHHNDWLEQTHGNWIKSGFNMISLMNCADTFSYCNGQYNKNFASDICFIGGYWPYKAQTLDKYILPLCAPEKNYNIKIFGNSNWPSSKYCGHIPEEMTRHVLRSAKVCVNVSEPHSQEFGYDIISRPFNLLANNCFCISDDVEGLKRLFPDSIIYTNNPKDFEEAIHTYTTESFLTLRYIQKGFSEVMEKHTAFDRMIQVFDSFKISTDELTSSKNKFMEYLNDSE